MTLTAPKHLRGSMLNKQRRQTLAASSANRKGRVTVSEIPTPWDHGATGQANRAAIDPDTARRRITNDLGLLGVGRHGNHQRE